MRSRSNDFLLGTVVLAFVTLFVATVIFFTPVYRAKTRPVRIEFEHDRGVAPIKVGSPVLLSGALQIGKVTNVTTQTRDLTTPSGRERHLIIVVDTEIDDALDLFEDCQITTDQPPVGGGGVVVILTIGRSPRPLVAGKIVTGLPPQSFAAAIGGLSRALLGPGGLVEKLDQQLDATADGSVMNRLVASLDDVNGITSELRMQLSASEQQTLMGKLLTIGENVNALTASLRDQMRSDDQAALLAKVHVALDHLAAALQEVNGMIGENRPALAAITSNVSEVTSTLSGSVAPALAAEFRRDDPQSLLGKLHASMDGVRKSTADLAEMTDASRILLVGNRPALQRTIDNLKSTSDRLRVGVSELLLAPWRLVQPPESQLQRLDIFEAARYFAEAAANLDDSAERMEAILAASKDGKPIASEADLREIQGSLKAAFDRFQQAETFLWDKMK